MYEQLDGLPRHRVIRHVDLHGSHGHGHRHRLSHGYRHSCLLLRLDLLLLALLLLLTPHLPLPLASATNSQGNHNDDCWQYEGSNWERAIFLFVLKVLRTGVAGFARGAAPTIVSNITAELLARLAAYAGAYHRMSRASGNAIVLATGW